MERLEAALEKARKNRGAVRPPVQISSGSKAADTPPADKWAGLKEITISPRVARNNRISTLTKSANSGSYDLLRSRTLRLMQDNNWSTLAITSPNKTCGKSTICVNLALSLARQSDLRIIVLDFDMHRPSIHNILGYRPHISLHEVIKNGHQMDEFLVRIGDNLAFGLNNKPASAPSELLQSKLARTTIEKIKRDFRPDLMIFDMPPMLLSDDHVGFLPAVDCSLLVGAADSTTITQLNYCEKELAELTNVLGVVLNKCRYPDQESGYGYEYY
jgi:Mrp family chromosome partitioning ATPase